MARRLSEVDETLYQKYYRKLVEDWGFDTPGARVFASALARKSFSWKNSGFRLIRVGRREAVIERYKAAGGTYKEPDFTKSDIAKQAVRLESIDMSNGGFTKDSMTDWWIKYYYGIDAKSSWNEAQSMFRDKEKETKAWLFGQGL